MSGPQSRSGRVQKISPPPGFDLRTVQPVASRYTNCAIPALAEDKNEILTHHERKEQSNLLMLLHWDHSDKNDHEQKQMK